MITALNKHKSLRECTGSDNASQPGQAHHVITPGSIMETERQIQENL